MKGELGKGPGQPPKHPRVLIVELGEVFDSYTEAANRIGGNRGAISNICNNYLRRGGRQTHLGYHFKHVE